MAGCCKLSTNKSRKLKVMIGGTKAQINKLTPPITVKIVGADFKYKKFITMLGVALDTGFTRENFKVRENQSNL